MALTPEMEKYLAKCERGLGVGLEGVLAAEVRRLDAALEAAEAAADAFKACLDIHKERAEAAEAALDGMIRRAEVAEIALNEQRERAERWRGLATEAVNLRRGKCEHGFDEVAYAFRVDVELAERICAALAAEQETP